MYTAVVTTPDNEPAVHIREIDNIYTGDIITMATSVAGGTGFNFVTAQADNALVFQIRGDGFLFLNSMDVVGSGEINSANMTSLTLLSGGITIENGGLVVRGPAACLYLWLCVLRAPGVGSGGVPAHAACPCRLTLAA